MVGGRRQEAVSKQATRLCPLSSKLEWQIEQFEKLMKLFKNGQNLVSRTFGSPQAASVSWELHVYPNGKREEDANHVSFFLRQVGLSRGEEPIMTDFQIYAVDGTGNRISVCRDTKDFSNQQGRGKFQVARDKMLNALDTDGSLLLYCEVEFFSPGFKPSVEETGEMTQEETPEKTVQSEPAFRSFMREMLDKEMFPDCIIKIGKQQLKAHRCFLANNSDVFKSMLSSEMKEGQQRTIDITDARFESVKAMLSYMYTGEAELDEDNAEEVLAIADKYAVLPLKDKCERYLMKLLTLKTITSMCCFADMYSAEALKQACIKFLVVHHKVVVKGTEWKSMKKMKPDLANELLESILSNGAVSDEYSPSDRARSRSPIRKRARKVISRS